SDARGEEYAHIGLPLLLRPVIPYVAGTLAQSVPDDFEHPWEAARIPRFPPLPGRFMSALTLCQRDKSLQRPFANTSHKRASCDAVVLGSWVELRFHQRPVHRPEFNLVIYYEKVSHRSTCPTCCYPVFVPIVHEPRTT